MKMIILKKRLNIAIQNVIKMMKPDNPNSLYSRGLSSEGFWGGYAQALADIQLLSNDVEPNRNREIWNKEVKHDS